MRACPRQTDGRTDEHHGNNATIRFTNALRAKMGRTSLSDRSTLYLSQLLHSELKTYLFEILSTTDLSPWTLRTDFLGQCDRFPFLLCLSV